MHRACGGSKGSRCSSEARVVPGFIVPLKSIEFGVDGDLIRIYSRPYSIYLRGTIGFRV